MHARQAGLCRRCRSGLGLCPRAHRGSARLGSGSWRNSRDTTRMPAGFSRGRRQCRAGSAPRLSSGTVPSPARARAARRRRRDRERARAAFMPALLRGLRHALRHRLGQGRVPCPNPLRMMLRRRLGPNVSRPVGSRAGRRPPASRLTGHAIARIRRELGKYTPHSGPPVRNTPPSAGPAGSDARHSRAQAAQPPPQRGWPGRRRAARAGRRAERGGGRASAPSLRRQPDSMSRPDASADAALAPRSSFQGTAFSADSPACRAARSRICALRRRAPQQRAGAPWRLPRTGGGCAYKHEHPHCRRAAHAASLPTPLGCLPRATDCTAQGASRPAPSRFCCAAA